MYFWHWILTNGYLPSWCAKVKYILQLQPPTNSYAILVSSYCFNPIQVFIFMVIWNIWCRLDFVWYRFSATDSCILDVLDQCLQHCLSQLIDFMLSSILWKWLKDHIIWYFSAFWFHFLTTFLDSSNSKRFTLITCQMIQMWLSLR